MVQSSKGNMLFDSSGRQLKTQAQIDCLEKCYNAHKYPSEDVKQKLAEELTLSVKQVNRWFSRKREKERRAEEDNITNKNICHSNVVPKKHSKKCKRLSELQIVERQEFIPLVHNNHQYTDLECAEVASQECLNISESDLVGLTSGPEETVQQRQRYRLVRITEGGLNGNHADIDANSLPCQDEGFYTSKSKRRRLDMTKRQTDDPVYPVSTLKIKMASYPRREKPSKSTVFDSLPPGAFGISKEAIVSEDDDVSGHLEACGLKEKITKRGSKFDSDVIGSYHNIANSTSLSTFVKQTGLRKERKQSGGKLFLPSRPSFPLKMGKANKREQNQASESGGTLCLPSPFIFVERMPGRSKNSLAAKQKKYSEKLAVLPLQNTRAQEDAGLDVDLDINHQSLIADRYRKVTKTPFTMHGKNQRSFSSVYRRKQVHSQHLPKVSSKTINKRKEAAKKFTTSWKDKMKKICDVPDKLVESDCLELMEFGDTSDPDYLASVEKFPVDLVKMSQPVLIEPLKNSIEDVKKLFEVFHFLYTYADLLKLVPFTFDDFVQAFKDCDSMLLGRIHISLLTYLLEHVHNEMKDPINLSKRTCLQNQQKNCCLARLIKSVSNRGFDVKLWQAFLNPLTWPEILRQVLIDSGFDTTKRRNVQNKKKAAKKESNVYASHGLIPGTLKFALFHILMQNGTNGTKVTEISKQVQKFSLKDIPSGNASETLILSCLSSDITLFERISSLAFRVRTNIPLPGACEQDTCSESSVDINSDSDNSDTEGAQNSGYENFNQVNSEGAMGCVQSLTVSANPKLAKGRDSIGTAEIDESNITVAWVQGLPERDYAKLGVKEKFNVFMALVNLVRSGRTLKKKFEEGHPDDSSNNKKRNNSKSTASSQKKLQSFSRESICMGTDRRNNAYWQFCCFNIEDPGLARVYFQSSEDGHWAVIDNEEALDTLMSLLDCRNDSESNLLDSLKEREKLIRKEMVKENSRRDLGSRDSSSGISVVENSSDSASSEPDNYMSEISGAIQVYSGTRNRQKQCKLNGSQDFHKWVWDGFFQTLKVLKYRTEKLLLCRICHDLFWPEEGHCMVCHTTIELDFDTDEKYAVHTAKCNERFNINGTKKQRALPSPIQSLKAAMQAIEAALPPEAFVPLWRKSTQNVWIKHLRHASSLSELAQVLTDFQSAIRDDWLHVLISTMQSKAMCGTFVPFFSTAPQTTASIAFWLVRLDAFISTSLEEKHRSRRLEAP